MSVRRNSAWGCQCREMTTAATTAAAHGAKACAGGHEQQPSGAGGVEPTPTPSAPTNETGQR